MRIGIAGLLLGVFISACGGVDSQEQSSSEVKGIGACIQGHMTEQCLNQRVCRVVCTSAGGAGGAAVGGGIGAAGGIAAATQVCSELCELVPQCSEVFVCDKYERVGL